jgi:endonuclease YncB( thermonuclease family)
MLLCLLLFSAPAFGADVTDGDGLRLKGERIRLWGIDAPELGQPCAREGATLDCGAFAKGLLSSLTSRGQVECEKVDTDRYGRTVARCFVDGLDLGSMMVSAGWALDFERYSDGFYALEQEQARQDRRGLWGLEFTAPWDWRAARRGRVDKQP